MDFPDCLTVVHEALCPRIERQTEPSAVRDSSHQARIVEVRGKSGDFGVVVRPVLRRRRLPAIFDRVGGVEQPGEVRSEQGRDSFARGPDEKFRLRRVVRVEEPNSVQKEQRLEKTRFGCQRTSRHGTDECKMRAHIER